jgi:cystathionine beta-lyase/cystathionine gamma-synthase
LHPGLETEAESASLTGFSGLFSFELDAETCEEVAAFVDRLRRFRVGVSWGGVESLVLAPNRGNNAEALLAQGIAPGLVRLSVGLEGAGTLIDDLDRSLAAL